MAYELAPPRPRRTSLPHRIDDSRNAQQTSSAHCADDEPHCAGIVTAELGGHRGDGRVTTAHGGGVRAASRYDRAWRASQQWPRRRRRWRLWWRRWTAEVVEGEDGGRVDRRRGRGAAQIEEVEMNDGRQRSGSRRRRRTADGGALDRGGGGGRRRRWKLRWRRFSPRPATG